MLDKKREKYIKVRLNDYEYDFFKNKIKNTNLTMSDYIRRIIFEGKINIIEPMSICKMQDLGRELQKIGVNINQIAKSINERGGVYDKRDMESILEEHNKLQAALYSRLYLPTQEDMNSVLAVKNVKCVDMESGKMYKVIKVNKLESETHIVIKEDI